MQLVAGTEPDQVAPDDVLEAGEVVWRTFDAELESFRRAGQLGPPAGELDPALLPAVGPFATVVATQVCHQLLAVPRGTIRHDQGFTSTSHLSDGSH